tara:strand:- start:112 stop:216 length:105 start_codon:yes stop_codon:yes gene_type:complete
MSDGLIAVGGDLRLRILVIWREERDVEAGIKDRL